MTIRTATSSVGGLLWSLAGLAVFIVLAINWRLLVGIAVFLAVALPLLEIYGPLVLPETFQVRVLQALEAGDLQQAGTFSSRMGLIHEALEVVDERLLFGMGVDQYRAKSEMGAPVHDIYLLLWAEGGLPALIGWLMLPQLIALTALRMLGRRPRGRLIGATTLAVVTVFLLAATGSAHMYARFWVVPLHLCLALLVTSSITRPAPPPGSPSAPGGRGRAGTQPGDRKSASAMLGAR